VTGASARPPADPRASVGDLLARIVAEDDRSRAAWAVEIILVAAANVLVLYSVDRALSVDTGPRFGALLTFGVAIAINAILQGSLAQRVLDALSAAVSRTTEGVLDALARLDLEGFEAVGGAEIVGRVTEDASRVVPGGAIVVQGVVAAATVVLSTLYVATISPLAALIAGLALGLTMLLIARSNRAIAGQLARDQAGHRAMREPIDDLLAGFKQLKQHSARSAAVAAAFEREASALKHSREAYHAEFFARDTWTRQLFMALLFGIGFVFPVLAPSASVDLSRLLVAVTFIFRPVMMILMAAPLLVRLGATWQRLTDLVARLTALASDEDEATESSQSESSQSESSQSESPETFSRLALRDVLYRYPAQAGRPSFTVGPCDLELAPGEIVFITGVNGSGKSTFLRLLCGLYRRHGGDMRIDDVSVPVDPGSAWRCRYATVFAEVTLFERLYGREDVDPAQVTALLAEMELASKVRYEHGRFTTIDLSTGQRKRLALVVALLEDRPIYVFDEWAADQDPHFRAAFYRRILPALKARGKTVVAVTHDDDAFDACDRRIHFLAGKMVPT